MKPVTISVTIPYVTKLELCPLISAIFLISTSFGLSITRPYMQHGVSRTISYIEQAAVSVPIVARSIKLRGTKRQITTPVPAVCGGSANGCWLSNYSIENDTDTTWPNTGRVVEYNLTITNSTNGCAPEGTPRACFLVNGQSPGPTIEANWGDIVKVNVANMLQDNGTSIHFHGIRQLGTNDQDGVGGLTECPLAPGQTRTYQWQATQYGTSWYHSHFSAQYGDGVLGPIVIQGPSTAAYDLDMGPTLIQELYRGVGATEFDAIIGTQGPLTDTPDNILYNGINVNEKNEGTRLEYELTPGAKHLMRFVNGGVDNHYKVGIDGHMMQVISLDLTPVQPYMTQYVSLGVGQRFEAIVTANSNDSSGAFWMRVIPTTCAVNKYNGLGVQNAIIRYKGAPPGLPTTQAAPLPADNCFDEPNEVAVPFVAKTIDSFTFDPYHLPVASPQQVTTTTEGRVFRWTLGKTTQSVDYQSPILQRFVDGNNTISPEDNIVGVDQPGWAFWYLQNNFYEAHPIHMHGNDLNIIKLGNGQWSENTTESDLKFVNPMRRDTFMLPAGGYAILAFQTDNPGIWLMHCHIAWHASQGLSTSLYVRKDEIKEDSTKATVIREQCQAWNDYQTGSGAYAPGASLPSVSLSPGNSTTRTGLGGVAPLVAEMPEVGAQPNAQQMSAVIQKASGGPKYTRIGSGV